MVSIIASRSWRGYEDLPAMQGLAVEQRRLLGARAPWHIGDLAWGFRQHEGREHEWRVRLWEDGGRVVAWSWLKTATGKLKFDVDADRRDLLDSVLSEPDARTAVAFEDDDEVRSALARHGFVHAGESLRCLVRDLSEPPPLPPLRDGFRYRTIGSADLAERVAIHREVWAPSRVTEPSYANVMAAWPYRASLDCAVEAPDGHFVGYCLVWPDDETRVGELEPVGVREAFRQRGFGAAVCTFALQRLYEEGGREAIVYCDTNPACELYRSLGFHVHGTIVGWSR